MPFIVAFSRLEMVDNIVYILWWYTSNQAEIRIFQFSIISFKLLSVVLSETSEDFQKDFWHCAYIYIINKK